MKKIMFIQLRKSIFLLLTLILIFTFTGCGGSTDNEDIVLKVGSTKDYKTSNLIGDEWYNVLASITTHDSLIKLDENVELSPWLATEWDISSDSTEFTFTITDNAKWHDGNQLTADDVKFSLEYYRDNVPFAGWMKDVIDTVETDGNTVKVNLKKPYGNFLIELMSYDILPKHIWENVDDPQTYNGDDVSIGSGSFKLEKWDMAAGKFIFIANEDYFQGKPTIDRLEIDVFANMDVLVMALARGDIDTWWDYSGEFPYTNVPALIKAGNIEFANATFLGVPAALGFNLDRYPTNELDFRKAIALSINYEQIRNIIYQGYGSIPTYGFVPSSHSNFNEAIPSLEYNPDEARDLLQDLGFQDSNENGIVEATPGEDLELKLICRSDKINLVRAAEFVKDYLEDVGISVDLHSVDFSTWYAIKEDLDYDIAFFRCTPWGTMMHAGHGSGYFDSRRTGMGVLHNLNDQEYLDTCDERLATALPEAQIDLDLEIQQLHYEYLPGIALVWLDSIYPYRSGWENWIVDQIFGGVVNSFSWHSVTKSQQ
jgi:peptide/nickel transport system substrate-binding protein